MSGTFRLPLMSGSSVQSGDYLVRFIDYDGEVLKEQWVNSGEDATAPETPEHEDLEFYQWNKGFTNVTKNLDVGAIYESATGDTYLYIRLTGSTGLSPRLYLQKASAIITRVDWGDGTVDALTTSGNVYIEHTYQSIGDYVISIESSTDFNLGWGSSSYKTFYSNYIYTVLKVILGPTAYLGNYSFNQARSLELVSFGAHLSQINSYCFSSCFALKGVTLPSNCTVLKLYAFNGISAAKNISLSKSTTTIEMYALNYIHRLQSIIIPEGVTIVGPGAFNQVITSKIEFQGLITSIGNDGFSQTFIENFEFPSSLASIGTNAFGSNYIMKEVVFKSVTPPSLASNSFNFLTLNIHKVKIYVPDASVTAYKAATNWVTISDYIYPLSSRL